jgi:hypothetical protein
MQWPICYYQTSIVVVLIIGISMEMLNNIEKTKGVWKYIMVGHGLNGMMKCIHLYWMIKTILKQRKYVDNNVTLGRWMMLLHTQHLSNTMYMKKTNYHISVTITTNWPLHMDSSRQLVIMFPSRDSRIWSFNCGDYHTVTKFLEKILMGV